MFLLWNTAKSRISHINTGKHTREQKSHPGREGSFGTHSPWNILFYNGGCGQKIVQGLPNGETACPRGTLRCRLFVAAAAAGLVSVRGAYYNALGVFADALRKAGGIAALGAYGEVFGYVFSLG